MHKEVVDWVKESVEWWGGDWMGQISVLEFGSLNMNGSIRATLEWPRTEYLGIDTQFGKGVNIVADAAVFRTDSLFDIVVCCEVFEHTPKWRDIVKNARRNLKPGGLFVVTMAGEGRHPHSGVDGLGLRAGEYYQNITGPELETEMKQYSKYEVNVLGADTRGRAIK